jgi:hypothetical protein
LWKLLQEEHHVKALGALTGNQTGCRRGHGKTPLTPEMIRFYSVFLNKVR